MRIFCYRLVFLVLCAATVSSFPVARAVASGEEAFVPAGNYWKMRFDHSSFPVYLDEFYIDIFPVSVSDYARCVDSGDCSDAPIRRFAQYGQTGDDYGDKATGYPESYEDALEKARIDGNRMVYVQFDEAMTYCAAAGKRLPTVAEWGKAARGGDNQHEYAWGNAPPDCTNVNWKNCPNASAEAQNTHFKPGPYGTYNMFSGAGELLLDMYHQDFNYDEKITRNPLCTRDMYDAYPLKKESASPSHRASGLLTDLSGGRGLYASTNGGMLLHEDLSNGHIGFRCVRSKLMETKDFNR